MGEIDEHVEKVAEALWRADYPDMRMRTWADVINKTHYRHLAAAAIEALGLREVYTWSWPETLTASGQPGYGHEVTTLEEAQAEADPYMTIVSRLASEWAPVTTESEQR